MKKKLLDRLAQADLTREEFHATVIAITIAQKVLTQEKYIKEYGKYTSKIVSSLDV